MKIGFWLKLLFIGFEVSVYLTYVECFTIPISVSTGMAIIMALVKIKAVIVKVLLGLKYMGYESFVWRTSRRRRGADMLPVLNSTTVPSILKSPVMYQEELLEAWNDLQETVGKVIQFDLESCTAAAISKRKVRLDFPWDNVSSEAKANDSKAYSTWVSKILGSTIGDPLACQILDDELRNQNIQAVPDVLSKDGSKLETTKS